MPGWDKLRLFLARVSDYIFSHTQFYVHPEESPIGIHLFEKAKEIEYSYASVGRHPKVCSGRNNANRLFVVQIIIVQTNQTSR
jgi:hypothetical protein